MGNSKSQVTILRIKKPVDLDVSKARINSFGRNKLYSFPYSLQYGYKIMKKRGIFIKKRFTSVSLLDRRHRRFFNPSNIFSLKVKFEYQDERKLGLKLVQSCHRLRRLKIDFGAISYNKELLPLMRLLKRLKRLNSLSLTVSLFNWQNDDIKTPIRLGIPEVEKIKFTLFGSYYTPPCLASLSHIISQASNLKELEVKGGIKLIMPIVAGIRDLKNPFRLKMIDNCMIFQPDYWVDIADQMIVSQGLENIEIKANYGPPDDIIKRILTSEFIV